MNSNNQMEFDYAMAQIDLLDSYELTDYLESCEDYVDEFAGLPVSNGGDGIPGTSDPTEPGRTSFDKD